MPVQCTLCYLPRDIENGEKAEQVAGVIHHGAVQQNKVLVGPATTHIKARVTPLPTAVTLPTISWPGTQG